MHLLRRGTMLGGIVLVLLAIASVQFGASMAKSLFDTISAQGLTFVRLAIAALVMLCIARPRLRGHDRTAWLWMLGFGLSLAGMNLLYYLAIVRIPLGVAVTIELLGPLALAMVQTRRLIDWLWVGLAVTGLALVGFQSFQGELDPVGVAFAAGAGCCWALYIIASKHTGASVPGVGGLAIAMVLAAIAVAPFGLLDAIGAVQISPAVLLPGIGIALLSSAIPYAFELIALRRIPSRVFGVLMSIEPAAAALFGLLMLHETIGAPEVLAIVLVVLASAGVAVTAARGEPKPSTGIVETLTEPPGETGPLPPTP